MKYQSSDVELRITDGKEKITDNASTILSWPSYIFLRLYVKMPGVVISKVPISDLTLLPDGSKLIGILQMQWNEDGPMQFCESHSYNSKMRTQKKFLHVHTREVSQWLMWEIRLPRKVLESPSVEIFKRHVDVALWDMV